MAIGRGESVGRIRRSRWWLVGGAALIVVAVAAFSFRSDGTDSLEYKLAKVDRGAVAKTISASGALKAVVTVEVGTQVSGQIMELKADYNTEVTAGQVIARIDPAVFEAKVAEAEAELAVAKATLGVQQASLEELAADIVGAQAALKDMSEDLNRKQTLAARRIVAESQVDKAVSERDQAAARVAGANAKVKKQHAQIENARAQVKQREAALQQRRLDLEHATIRSPVDGVVISRSVDIGQTVAASLQAPTLFTIAQDLRQMQVEVNVDEADIGGVQEGQRATFTVDSFPEQEFPGIVRQIRLAPVEVQNVVTYTVVVGADNAEMRLLPGMTANISIVTGERTDVLRVPSAALRFSPPNPETASAGAPSPSQGPEAARERARQRIERLTKTLDLTAQQRQAVEEISRETGQKVRALMQSGTPRDEIATVMRQLRAADSKKIETLLTPPQLVKYQAMQRARGADQPKSGRVFVIGPDGAPKPVDVLYGLSDGTRTAILRGDLEPGASVVVGRQTAPEKAPSRLRFGL